MKHFPEDGDLSHIVASFSPAFAQEPPAGDFVAGSLGSLIFVESTATPEFRQDDRLLTAEVLTSMKVLDWVDLNLVVDSLFKDGIGLWQPDVPLPKGVTYKTNLNATYTLEDGGTGYIRQASDDLIEDVRLVYHAPGIGPVLPVKAGSLLRLSGLFAAHRCHASLDLHAVLPGGRTRLCERLSVTPAVLGGTTRNSYRSLDRVALVPDDAVGVMLVLRKSATARGTDSYFFFTDVRLALTNSLSTALFSTDVPADVVGSLAEAGGTGLKAYRLARLAGDAAVEVSVPAPSADVEGPVALAGSPLRLASRGEFEIAWLATDQTTATWLLSSAVDTSVRALMLPGIPSATTKDFDILVRYSRIAVAEGASDAGVIAATRVASRVGVDPANRVVDVLLRSVSGELPVRISIGASPEPQSNSASSRIVLTPQWQVHRLKLPTHVQNSLDEVWITFQLAGEPGAAIDLLGIAPTSANDPLSWTDADLSNLDLASAGNHAAATFTPRESYGSGITVITPTGDRPAGLRLLTHWMSRQTRQPDQWIIVDDGQEPLNFVDELPPYATYVRRERQDTDYPHTLANQLLHALPLVEHDKIVIMEDDDWYRQDYLAFMYGALDTADLVGCNTIHYYHYTARAWKKGKPLLHTSLAQSGLRARALPHLAKICASQTPLVRSNGLVDRFLWHTYPGPSSLISEHEIINVGLKGTPGRPGIAEGHKTTDAGYMADAGRAKLLSLVGNDMYLFDYYYGRLSRGVIYTATSGGVDALLEPGHKIPGVDYICFTDSPGMTSKVWTFRPLESEETDPVRRAKAPKLLPHRYFPEYEWSLWVDANTRIRADLEHFIIQHLAEARMSAFKHPDRKCVYVEADACLDQGKDDPTNIWNQIRRYKREGMPKDYGMAECNILLRHHNDPSVVEFMEAWWDEVKNGSRRDQLSFPYLRWKLKPNFKYFFNGEKIISQQNLVARVSHYAGSSRVGSRIVYAAEAALADVRREITKSTGQAHVLIQTLPVNFSYLETIAVKVATHKGQAVGPTTMTLFGLAVDGGEVRETELRTVPVPVSAGDDNRYCSADFEGIDVSPFQYLRMEISSRATGAKRPVSFYLLRQDNSPTFVRQNVSVDGATKIGQICFAVQAR